MVETILRFSLCVGWWGGVGGVASGAVIGLLFHNERCTLFDINFQPDRMTVGELRSGFHELARHLYAPDFVERRNRAFRGHLRQSVVERKQTS